MKWVGNTCLGILLLASAPVWAEPYLAVREGFQCAQCHVNPTGGGLRSPAGTIYGQTQLPARQLRPADSLWTGAIGSMLQLGGDLRGGAGFTDAPELDSSWAFDLNEFRLYADVSLLPQRLEVYVDERLAPGGASNLQAFLKYTTADGEWYAKAGQLLLPYGWRLEDDGAFIRQITGNNFNTPDRGVEVGWQRSRWSAQLSLSNGTAGGVETDNGKQINGRLEYVRDNWRAGASGSHNDSDAGDRSLAGLFCGLRTGPVSWLGEADYIVDEGTPTGRREEWVGFVEANWLMRKGQNLKVTAEFFDPDLEVDEDEQNRFSLVWEYTPMEFIQLRAGARSYDGIPQNSLQNRTEAFLELHGYF